jgi:hypothetical protein
VQKYYLSIIVNLPNWNDRIILNLGKCSSMKENFNYTAICIPSFQDATTTGEEEEEVNEEA